MSLFPSKAVICTYLLFLMITTPAFSAPENQKLKGVLKDMNIVRRFFSVSLDKGIAIFSIDNDTIFLQGEHTVFFSDIVPGDKVEVLYQIKWRKNIARVVQVEPSDWRKKSYKGGYGY